MRKRTAALLPLLFLAIVSRPVPVAASERAIVMGAEDAWAAVVASDGVILTPGRGGYQDLVLRAYAYRSGPATELLMQFDALPLSDLSGNFTVFAPSAELSTAVRRTGVAALLVDGPEDRIELIPGPTSGFRPGLEWGSFSIDFWLYPVLLPDGAAILSWRGREGAALGFREQQLLVTARSGRIEVRFDNFFVRPDGSGVAVTLRGDRQPIPRAWAHHAIRFDARTALLEYLVDGVPVDVTHVSASGRQDGSVYFPRIAASASPGLVLADGFIGAVDEVRIERGPVPESVPPRYHPEGGRLLAGPVDLGSIGAVLRRITAVADTPGLSDVFLYYHLSDLRVDPARLPEESWTPVASGETPAVRVGRFLSVRADLLPDTRTGTSPRLSELRVTYVPDPPPLPPTRVRATARDGAVSLEWDPVHDPDIRGYLVYYGDQSGRYFGSESSLGRSPVDVGNVTSVTIPGLSNGTLHFFAVSAYDAAGSLPAAGLSQEVAARPARIHR